MINTIIRDGKAETELEKEKKRQNDEMTKS